MRMCRLSGGLACRLSCSCSAPPSFLVPLPWLLLPLHQACMGRSPRPRRMCSLFAPLRRWLHRALQFAAFMEGEEFRAGARTPDHPLSLFEGCAGRLGLLADLTGGPHKAAFPMFEVDF